MSELAPPEKAAPHSSSPSSGQPSASAWYGPRILVVGFVSYLISTGFIFSIFGVFIRPAGEGFGVNMATMGFVPVLYHLMSATVSPVIGRRFAHARIRHFMLFGACLLPVGLLAVSRAATIGQAAFCFAGMAVLGSIIMGPLASNTLVTHWYGQSRGWALGIISTGTTAAGILLPPLAAFLIGLHGWRDALGMLALMGLFVSLPTIFAFAVDRPGELGQEPEGGEASSSLAGPPISSIEPATPTVEILRKPYFWTISAMFSLLFVGGLIALTFTVPYAEQLGLSLQQGAWILAVRSLASIFGQITLGWLSDRIGRKPVMGAVIATAFVCWLVIAFVSNVWAFALAGIGMGFVDGSYVALRGALVATVFGRRDFSTVSGLMVPAALPIQVLALPVAGHIFDVTGDYGAAFRAFLFVFPLAALLLLTIPERSPTPTAT